MSAPVRLLVCTICRRPADDGEGPGSGVRLATALRAAVAGESVKVDIQACLMNCWRDCTIHMTSKGKPGYVLESLAAGPRTVEAVLGLARAYAESPDGSLDAFAWPGGLEGRIEPGAPPGRLGMG